jgi:hypothetical protein
MDEVERSTKRRGLFRRNRDEFEQDRPLTELGTVEDDESITVPSLSKRPRSTADMFATPKEKFADNWSDDAWDDEWKEPAFRRPSIPSAASPEPEQVDAWLENDASAWDDVTRDSVRRMGGDPGIATQKAARGSTWDSTSDLGPIDTAIVVANQKRGGELEEAIERALASVQATEDTAEPKAVPQAPTQGESETRSGTPETNETQRIASSRFGRERSTAIVTESLSAASPAPTTQPADLAVDLPKQDQIVVDLVRESASTVSPSTVSPSTISGTSPSPILKAPTADLAEVAEIDAALNDPTAPGLSTTVLPDKLVAKMPEKPVERDKAASSSVVSEAPKRHLDEWATTEPSAQKTDSTESRRTHGTPEVATTKPEHSEEDFLMDRTRAAAFVDRASWIGAGVALVTALRLMLHLASSMKLGNPSDAPLSAGNRIGQAFANIGPMHGLLMIAAIALLALPSVMAESVDVPRRTGTGVGIVIGCALLGLMGGIVGLAVQSTLATRSGSVVTLADRAEIIALIGLSLVALGGALRTLSSYESDGEIN